MQLALPRPLPRRAGVHHSPALQARRPRRRVLGQEKRIPVHERGIGRMNAIDRTTAGVERDAAGRLRRRADAKELLDTGQQLPDRSRGQRPGEEVGLSELGLAGELAGRHQRGQMAFRDGQVTAACLSQHRRQVRRLERLAGRLRADGRVQRLQQRGGIGGAAEERAAHLNRQRNGSTRPGGQVQVRPDLVALMGRP